MVKALTQKKLFLNNLKNLIKIEMINKNLITENYKRFCHFEGSQHIASEFALEIIIFLIEKYNIKNILELGLGIGSICDTVLKYAKQNNKSISYVGTESNEFCLNALKSNVDDYDKIELYPELKNISFMKFDLVIIDGQDSTFGKIKEYCKENAIIFIEGDRKEQTNDIKRIFPNNKHVNIITLAKSKPYAHGDCKTDAYIGGGQLIFINPTINQKRYWLEQKIKTYFKRKIRSFNY